jgi:flagellar biosynthesis protein FliR
MNIFSESFAFRLLAGMGVMTLTLPLVGQHAANYLRRLPDDVLRLARLLAGG